MSQVGKITILELAPCADSILYIKRDPQEGYIRAGSDQIILRSGAKLRPQVASTHAGGKATNVARVIDKLLKADDQVRVELIVFRPDSAEGRYIHELQAKELRRIQLRPAIINATARFCLNLSDPSDRSDNHVEFNISPRVIWEPDACEAALNLASQISTDLLLLAGNPPLIAPEYRPAIELYAQIVEQTRPRVRAVSLDTGPGALVRSLAAQAQPTVIKINHEEHASVDESLWRNYNGVLVVTDADGCWIYDRSSDRKAIRVHGAKVQRVYSTVGAGDAAHAGFTLARWVWGLDLINAARYGQAAAAAAVSSPEGTRGLDRQVVEGFFTALMQQT
jgi:fructose-1-phosphate kinase PfkB-like protein